MTPAAAPPEVAPGTSPELELIGRTNNLWGHLADVHEPPAELAGRAAEPAQRPATAQELGAELPAARSPRPALRLVQGDLDTPETTAPAPPAQPEPAARPGFQIANEAVLPRRLLARTKLLRGLTWLFQAVCIGYGAALLYWIWLAKDLSAALVLHDPVFGTYSLIVTAYVLARFALAPFYRPTPDTGLRPTASIVIPAFNEEACIGQTVDACYAAEYPDGKLEVVVVDDGSSDTTWSEMLAAQRRHPTLVCVRFSHNRGKRAAMAEGIRRSTGEVCVFIDSDSVIEPDGLGAIMADFRDERVGAVVGTADVLNKTKNPVTKMQQVRYYVAFRVIKGSESIFGAVTCASGCFSAYRREALLRILPRWENQRFLGRKATYGDDRALTNLILRDWRVTYQQNARSHTIAPENLKGFLIQQLRWKKSWLRESLFVIRFIWRKHPVPATLTYLSVLFPWIAPVVVFHSLYWRALGVGDPWFYLMGAYVMALLYSLYYAVSRKSTIWYHGITFIVIYMAVLVWQTYYAVMTLRNTSWGTRASTHNETEGEVLVVTSDPALEAAA